MFVLSRDWTLDQSLWSQDLVMELVEVGRALKEECTALLEGKEEEERSYLGFGAGWVLDDRSGSDPIDHLRQFINNLKKDLVHIPVSGGDGGESPADPKKSAESASPSADGILSLESGIMGYLDYEWGLIWQKPRAAKYRAHYFFRFCPINLVLLPKTSKLALEVFAEQADQAEEIFRLWEQAVTQKLNDLQTQHNLQKPHNLSNVKNLESPPADPLPMNHLQDDVTRPSYQEGSPAKLGTENSASSAISAAAVSLPQGWQSNMSKEDFIARVNRIKEEICAGEIFQAVFSQRFTRKVRACPWQIYRHLRLINPSPYLFYMEGTRETLVGSSPELLISTKGRKAATCPIAGTRPRGRDAAHDLALEEELRADVKENAEHAMLVDLGRNDLGRVSRYGTVNVAHYAEIVRYSHVMHLVSRVEGELKSECDGLDALKAVLPAGTLSGAPKVRAMEILQELEEEPRGYYGGSLGLVRWNGEIDFCITIRTMAFTGEQVSVQTGAGIVYDSRPEKEYEETIHKAMALMKVVNDCAHSD